MKTIGFSTMLVSLTLGLASASAEAPIPGGWTLETLSILQYRIGLDHQTRHGGKSAGFLRGDGDPGNRSISGSIVQSINAEQHRGQRLRFTAFVKTSDLDGWADFHTLIIGAQPDANFYTRQTRHLRITGSTDWNRHEAVFTVPADAVAIEVGITQYGAGQTWIDDVSIEVVEATGHTDEAPGGEQQIRAGAVESNRPETLENADFEQTKLEYDLALMQGRWESRSSDGRRKTKEIAGDTVTITDYSENGEFGYQTRQNLTLEQKGPVSLCTSRESSVTEGLTRGQKTPPGWSHVYLYSVNRIHLVEIFSALDGMAGPPLLMEWKRIPAE